MSYLEFGGRRHPIPIGEVALGCDAAGQVALAPDVQSQYAVLQGTADGQVAIHRAEAEAEILINGVRLGPQPTPLLHGDKVELAGEELLFVDDRRSGSTQFIQAVDPASMQEMLKSPAGQVATAGTGGRVVSLTDGREYSISGGSLLLGRDAGCDVVVPSKNVSRRHAEIVATPKGYILIDSSTNGTFVNGDRIHGQRLLARADVVRCGDHEFRFYADVKDVKEEEQEDSGAEEVTPEAPWRAAAEAPAKVAPPEPVAPAKVAPPEPAPPAPEPAEPPPPAAGARQRLANTMHGIPVLPRRPDAPVRPADKTPPEGAERRLADTMHGIPIVPRPAKPGPPSPKESPPPGAETRLSDTLLGVPVAPRPAQPAGPASKPDPESDDAKRASRPKWPTRPAQPGGSGSVPSGPDDSAGAVETTDKDVYPRTGEREAVLHEERGDRTAAPPPLASLIVRNGPLKGRHFEIKVPVVNVGRADYNDIVLLDDSVSTVHAKIQRREGIWVLVDQESTNGTVVDGQRVKGETVLTPGALIRFGSVQAMFQPTDDAVGSQKGGATRVMQPIEMSSQEEERRADSSSSES